MNIIDQVKAFLKIGSSPQEAPEGLCPNCWGRQNYGNQFFEAVKQEHIDLNNIDQKTGWVDAYAKVNFDGIKLTKQGDDSFICQTCNLSYRPA